MRSIDQIRIDVSRRIVKDIMELSDKYPDMDLAVITEIYIKGANIND